MKRIFMLILCLALLFAGCRQFPGANGNENSIGSPEPACPGHKDANDDDVCDVCGSSVIIVIDVYGINDLHGKLLDGTAHPGVDELTTYLTADTDHEKLLLSVGDMWQGSAESNATGGLMMTEWMNELDFAAMAMGNHEFDWGEDAILPNEELAAFPFLAINIYDRDTNQRVEYCDSSVTVECNGVQIGIIGAIGDCYSSIAPDHTKGIYFKTGRELTELVKAESEQLRHDGADFIIYLLHDGLGNSYTEGVTPVNNSQLASYYDPGLSNGYVDLVFEGHTHQRYLLQDSYGVYHLQNGGDNNGITYAQVSIHAIDGTVLVTEPELIKTDAYEDLEDAPLIDGLVEKYSEQVDQVMRPVGNISASRPGDTLRQLVADLYYLEGISRWGTDYDIVLGGGFISIRDPGYLARGEVTYGELQGLFPFDNELVLCSVKGRDLQEKFFDTDHYSYFICTGEYGEQVREKLDPDATYYIVVDTYTSTYAPNNLTEIERYGAPVYARDLLAQYIQNGGMN